LKQQLATFYGEVNGKKGDILLTIKAVKITIKCLEGIFLRRSFAAKIFRFLYGGS